MPRLMAYGEIRRELFAILAHCRYCHSRRVLIGDFRRIIRRHAGATIIHCRRLTSGACRSAIMHALRHFSSQIYERFSLICRIPASAIEGIQRRASGVIGTIAAHRAHDVLHRMASAEYQGARGHECLAIY